MSNEKEDCTNSNKTSNDLQQTIEDRSCVDELLMLYKNTYSHNNRSASILNSFKSYNDESILSYEMFYRFIQFKSFIDEGILC